MAKSQLASIPIREVVKRSGRRRQAVYKALEAGRLTKADVFGVAGVADDANLADFVKKAKADAKKKKCLDNGRS